MTFAPPPAAVIDADVARALAEDIGDGDVTADLVPATQRARATVIVRESAVIAGRPWFDAVFRAVGGAGIGLHWQVDDGDTVAPDTLLCTVQGPARALLTAERSALNFLQTLSATATATSRYVAAVAGTRARILDTRKTLPGLRLAQKYAVHCGGGVNHRIGLFDAMLIKENHIQAAGSITAAIAQGRTLHPGVKLEVEVETLDELDEALAAAPDIIMLDNFDIERMRDGVARVGGRIPLEASGNVTLDTIGAIAGTGVDFISVGAITKNVQAIDLSMRFHDL